jgi:hypothetical protein
MPRSPPVDPASPAAHWISLRPCGPRYEFERPVPGLARLPKGETNPLSARSRSSETKFVAKIGVGLLPFISTASVWLQQDRAVQPGFFGNALIGSLDFERRDGHEIRYRNSPLVNRMIGLCLRNRNTFESPLPNFPRDDRLEPRAIDNNKAPLPPTK